MADNDQVRLTHSSPHENAGGNAGTGEEDGQMLWHGCRAQQVSVIRKKRKNEGFMQLVQLGVRSFGVSHL